MTSVEGFGAGGRGAAGGSRGGEPPDDRWPRIAAAVRPRCRSDCRDGLRPCPHCLCRFNLLTEVGSDGRARLRRGWEVMTESCVLDGAERGGAALAAVAALLEAPEVTTRVVEERALAKLFGG